MFGLSKKQLELNDEFIKYCTNQTKVNENNLTMIKNVQSQVNSLEQTITIMQERILVLRGELKIAKEIRN